MEPALFRWVSYSMKELSKGNELKWSVRMSFAFLTLYSSQWFPESMRGRDL